MILYQKVDMNILRFAEYFPDAASCRNDFKAKREQEGLICKKCSSCDHYWLRISGNGNVSNAHFERPLGVGR